MNNLRLLNYRCFTDTGDIDIRPITLLLGANSTGKSSLLKFFPLLKQTLGEFNNGLFLWNGSLVDFQDFNNTVRDGQGEMTIGFTITHLPVRSRTGNNYEIVDDVRAEITLSEQNGNKHDDYIKRMSILFDKHVFLYENTDNETIKLTVDSLSSTELKDEIVLGYTNALLPKILFKIGEDEATDESPTAYKGMRNLMDNEGRIMLLRAIIRANDNVFDDAKLKEQIVKRKPRSINDKNIDCFINYLHYFTVNRLIDSINIYLMELGKRITYVKPLRAIVERYYRYSNLAVNEISADGSNLPMFYNSLQSQSMHEFNIWLEKLFGFSIKLEPLEGHLELLIQEKGKQSRNLVDVGFGYTQILPILTILWKKIYVDSITMASTVYRTYIVAIEQPELHLHPRFQGLFADMLSAVVKDAKDNDIDLRIVIETHSEIIVNRLGDLVASKSNPLKPQDVNVLIFNSQQDNLNQEINVAQFDDDGFLANWPYGFFSDYVY